MRIVRAFTLLISVLPVVAAHATTFTPGQFVTYGTVLWGEQPTPTNGAGMLESEFDTVYGPTYLMTVGGAKTMIFDNPDAVNTFESSNDYTPGVLTVDLLDPVGCGCGFMGGTTVALQLDVDFSAAGALPVGFGDLVLTDIEDVSTLDSSMAAFDGMTVSEFLAYQESVLGGGVSTPYSLTDLDTLSDDLAKSFVPDAALDFADEHLELPATTTATPEPATWTLMLAAAAMAPLARRRVWRRGA